MPNYDYFYLSKETHWEKANVTFATNGCGCCSDRVSFFEGDKETIVKELVEQSENELRIAIHGRVLAHAIAMFNVEEVVNYVAYEEENEAKLRKIVELILACLNQGLF